MGIERQNIQMRLAFPGASWGFTPVPFREGTEMPVAVCAPESPAEETAQPAEPPCTDPYARWCDRESLRRPTYVDLSLVTTYKLSQKVVRQPFAFAQDVGHYERIR